jgi:hypothetical protein
MEGQYELSPSNIHVGVILYSCARSLRGSLLDLRVCSFFAPRMNDPKTAPQI